MVIENEGLSKILNVGFATPQALSPEEWMRCSYYIFMEFNAWEYLYYQHRDDSIPKELWVGADESFKQFLETKSATAAFSRNVKTRSTNRFVPTWLTSSRRRIRRNDPPSPCACLTIAVSA